MRLAWIVAARHQALLLSNQQDAYQSATRCTSDHISIAKEAITMANSDQMELAFGLHNQNTHTTTKTPIT